MTGPPTPDPSAAAVGNELALRTALARLDDRDARALLSVYVDGLTLTEVADADCEELDVVCRRVARAMVVLGRALLDHRP